MARIKNFPPAKTPQQPKADSPPATVKSAWTAVIELGASNGQAMVKKPGGDWELVRWVHGVSASSVGGAEAIPAMTAIRKGGQHREMVHGHAAVRARKRNPGDWEIFAYPKLVFTDEGTTPDVQRTLDLQTEKATALGLTAKEIAIAFFRHMVSEVIRGRDEVFKIYMNISDRWPNRNVQELMLSLQSVRTDAQFENVDECLSSIMGRISTNTGSGPVEGVYVVIDCGHSGMNVGFAEVTAGPKYKVHRWKDYPAGAGEINMAVEDAVRRINRTNGAKNTEVNVWEVSECMDEYFKPEPGVAIDPRCGYSDEEWVRVIESAQMALRSLDRRRPDLAQPTIADALDCTRRSTPHAALHVLLTGRGIRSPPTLEAFRELISREFSVATVHEDKQTNITSVLAGLACIADNPNILSVKEVPVSLWLRSDPDEIANEEGCDTVIRVCTQGQDKDDASNLYDRVSASHPIHFELTTTDNEPPSLDLSVYGTAAGVSDDDIIKGLNADNFAYTSVDKVTEFGRFEQQLPRSTVKSGKRICHVYLYMEVSRLSVELYAIFAKDGRAVNPLKKTPFDRVLQDGELTKKWKRYQSVDLGMLRLRQVARPESLSTSAVEPSSKSHRPEVSASRESSALGSRQTDGSNARSFSIPRIQQIEATAADTSPSSSPLPQSSVTRLDEIRDAIKKRKRIAMLSQKQTAKRRTVSSPAGSKKKAALGKGQTDMHSTEDDKTESEMEM